MQYDNTETINRQRYVFTKQHHVTAFTYGKYTSDAPFAIVTNIITNACQKSLLSHHNLLNDK